MIKLVPQLWRQRSGKPVLDVNLLPAYVATPSRWPDPENFHLCPECAENSVDKCRLSSTLGRTSMRKSLWITLLVLIIFDLARVQLRSEPTAAIAQELPREPVRLTVLTSLGTETTLTIDEDTEVLVVATWCPYTERLNSALKDMRSRPYLAGKRLVYLFAYDELDRKANEWVRGGKISQAEADAYVDSQPRGPRLIDRTFLARAATQRIYYFDAEHPVRTEGFPSAFSGPPNEFLTNYGVWMSDRLGMSRELKDTFWAAYPMEGG